VRYVLGILASLTMGRLLRSNVPRQTASEVAASGEKAFSHMRADKMFAAPNRSTNAQGVV